jgi:hypothetical protein
MFEVVDLGSPYHALLGRPAFAMFMASTHIAYLNMKMSGPNGIVTITGNYKTSMDSASVMSSLAESMVIAEEKKRMHIVVALAQSAHLGMSGMGNLLSGTAFKPSNEAKPIVLYPECPECTILIGARLSEK